MSEYGIIILQIENETKGLVNMAKKKKRMSWQKKALICGTIAVCVLGLLYGGGTFYYKDKFFRGTKINGISCDNLTAKEAEKKLENKIEDYSLQISFRDGKQEEIRGEDIDYEYIPDGKIQESLEKQNPFLWISGFFKQREYEVGEAITFNEEKLQEKLNAFESMQDGNMMPPNDAYIAFENNRFVIKEEEVGTTLDKSLLMEKIIASVKESKNTFAAENEGIYVLPTVTSEDETLKHQQEVWNGCAAVTVTYTFGDKREVLDGMTVKDWMTYDENGNYVENLGVLQQHIRDYVQMLGEKYNTIGTERTIISTYTGGPVTVSGGSYGYLIDIRGERAQLLKDIQSHGNIEREPVYAKKGKAYGENDIGNTYVELDLSAQHLWYYKDGALLMESDLVSGTYNDASRRTPAGVYSLAYKQRNQVLRPAPNPDGGYDYETPVSYWMPFNGGIGLHDANWRGKFGGNIYKNSGSHGCINLPVSFAGKFYESIEAGCPIVCFYR